MEHRDASECLTSLRPDVELPLAPRWAMLK
jgi:hypothetical protein